MKSSTKLALFVLGVLTILVLISKVLNLKPKSFQISAIDFSSKWSFNFTQPKKPNDPGLTKLINRNLENIDGEFAFIIKSLNSKEENNFYYHESEPFPAGSLYKLFLLAATFEEIEKGDLGLEQEISASKGHLIEVLGSEEFGYEELEGDEISYKVSVILKRIAEISDNYASVMLAEKIGWDKVRNQVDKIGASSTTIKHPITSTASDVALFFEKLYERQVVSEDASNKIINLLSQSRLNDRIPVYLPKDVKVAHKTGELSRVRHDAGIVFLTGEDDRKRDASESANEENKAYLIVLMSKDLKFEDDGVEVLAKISKDVYEYFTNQSN